jgi:hypothetical protein
MICASERWRMVYLPYTEPGRGIVPPQADMLAELFDESERSAGDGEQR